MTDLERPGSSSRYTWTDDDDTELPAEGVAAEPPTVEDDVEATEHDLNLEVAQLEEDELREQLRRQRAEKGDGEERARLAWEEGDVSDRHAQPLDEDDVGEADDGPGTAPDQPSEAGGRVAATGADDAPAEGGTAVDGGLADSGVVYVFEPNTKTIPPVREYLAELWSRRKFMVELARSETRGSRSSTVLGELWGVIDPLFQVALYWFLLSIIRQGKGARGTDSLSQTLVLMVGGIFLFTLTSTTITAGGRSILSAKNLMLNSTFPRALLPLSAGYKAITEFIPTIFIYLIFHFAFGQKFGLGFFVLPLLFVIQVVLSIGIALIFATFTVFLRDTTNILGYLMRVLFFATPVIYPATSIPDGIRPFLQANPFFALFSAYQAIISGGSPNPIDLVVSAAWATLFITLGYRLFAANERSFALRL